MVHTVYGPPRQHISQSMVHTEVTPTLTNNEDSDEVPHNAASHQGPHSLLSNKVKTIPEYIVHSDFCHKKCAISEFSGDSAQTFVRLAQS